MSDIEDLISAAGASPGDAGVSIHEDLFQLIDAGEPGATPIPATPGSDASPERSAFMDIVEVVLAEPLPKRYKQSSCEFVAHTRDVCRAAQAEARALRLAERDDNVLGVVAKSMYRFPGVQTSQLCGKTMNYKDIAISALALAHAVFSIAVKGDLRALMAQAIACSVIYSCALTQQHVWLARVFRTTIESSGSPASFDSMSGEVSVIA